MYCYKTREREVTGLHSILLQGTLVDQTSFEQLSLHLLPPPLLVSRYLLNQLKHPHQLRSIFHDLKLMGSVFTYNQPSNPTISDAPPPAYGTHDKYSSYNEKDEKSDLPPPYQPPYVDTAGAYPTAPQAYPPPGGYAYPSPTAAAYPPPGAAPYPPAPGDTAYPPPGGQGPNWGTAAYTPYPPQT